MKYFTLFIYMAVTSTLLRAQEKIAFRVSLSEPQAHYADIEMEITGLKDEQIDLKMPVWTPGSYLVREFAKNVENFKASDSAGKALLFSKINKNTWRVVTGGNPVVKVKYKVYAFEVSVRTSFVDESHAFLSPTGLFLYPAGKLNLPSTVQVVPWQGWTKISTGLESAAGSSNTFTAPDFDILYDSPIEVGNQDVFEFTVAGVKHEVAMYGGGNYDKETLKRDMARIVEQQTAMFGVNPNKRYVFIVHNFTSGGGGLEHLNSAVLGASRNAYSSEMGLTRFLSLVSHEYFHLWNVKRLRPAALGPFNYDEENYTSDLWIAEGFTAYYQDIFVKRAGLISPEHYLNLLAASVSSVENQPGNRVQSVSEASFDAWIKLYRPNENSVNSTVSYYSKGALIAFIMDLDIIHSTKGQAGLDEVLRAMYDEYYVKLGRGFTDGEFRKMAEKIAGHSFADIYDRYINGVETIDYNKYLAYAGLKITDDAAGTFVPYLGAGTVLREGKLYVSQVLRNSPAWTSGLNVNDQIISIDDHRVNGAAVSAVAEMQKYIEGRTVGDKIRISVLRDGVPRQVEASLTRNPNLKYRISSVEKPDAAQIAVRKRWLKL